ncbi:MAG TPA: XrtB/PEP-CTERM-associated polysaccharide biosynthesis outer membrane protein EpsL [Burkholderiales bacterium]|nr:XrtB/PEP-CTERM-associated polysaccharide biosynthesis outer membrane protein EpsL [Burkholderiales bacterium]
MKRRMTVALAISCWCAASPALAAQSIDSLYWPETGKFPGYPEEPDTRRWTFSVFGGIDHDSNPFRLSDSADPVATLGSTQKSDTIYHGGLGLKGNIPISRQLIQIDLRAETFDYKRFDILDNTSYSGAGTWKWVAGPNWSGDVGYGRRRFMSNLAEIQAPLKDMVDEDHAFFNAGYMLSPRWKVRGGLDWLKWAHNEPSRETLDARISSGTIGLDYVTPQSNATGIQFKYTDGEFPNQQAAGPGAVDNSFKDYETSVVAHWMITGKSTLNGRLGYTKREHDQLAQRDFSGTTGRLEYDWYFAAKTLLNFALYRELRSSEDVNASYVLTEGWSLGPAWAPTSKTIFQAKWLQEDRDYRGDPSFVLAGSPSRQDTFRGLNLSAGYSPRRTVRLSIAVERGTRSSNVVLRDYDYTLVSGNAKLQF